VKVDFEEEYMNETEHAGNIVIGNDVSIKGVLVVPNRAVINGSVEGEVTAKELVVGQTGKIIGHAKTERADIHGEVNQTLDVSQSLILRSTGKVVGVVHYAELEIEKGGLVEGKMTQQAAPTSSQSSQTYTSPAPPPPPKDDKSDDEAGE
jgi:cytoskeletal protein CcmA (bactofilin family)